jgi:hypothetical protein
MSGSLAWAAQAGAGGAPSIEPAEVSSLPPDGDEGEVLVQRTALSTRRVEPFARESRADPASRQPHRMPLVRPVQGVVRNGRRIDTGMRAMS